MKFRTKRISNPKFENEGLRFITAKSNALKRRVDTSVYIPSEVENDNDKDVPVIVLLHGVYGSHWSWNHAAGAHLTLQRMINTREIGKFILVTPSDGLWGDGSGYVDHGVENYEAWISDELPALIRQEIQVVGDNSNFYIGGLSMGGWGAFWIGLRHSDIYKGISAHSAITELGEMSEFVEEDWSFWIDNNKINSITKLIESINYIPPFRFDCGTEDSLLQGNRDLHAFLEKKEISHLYEEFSGGHEWPYWKKNVAHTFRFFHNLRE